MGGVGNSFYLRLSIKIKKKIKRLYLFSRIQRRRFSPGISNTSAILTKPLGRVSGLHLGTEPRVRLVP